ncbi:biotin/lipoyl-containing protein [Clostridium rectalis]|uniref:biotin/lipoyl-containing protein n=1 Tax=Clostridium rectalis TaxID=2040295 RepID=UPI000F63F02F|nr:biotin/lipoyl-containing protein [Clostridium rectalis]
MKKFCVTVNGNKYEVEVEELLNNQNDEGAVSVEKNIKEDNNKVNMNKKAENNTSKKDKNKNVKGKKIESPMPGSILKINVTEGETIKKGQVLLILEAMKMENEIMAPCDGKVLNIHINKGAKVDTGDLLMVLE